ncbi:MAG TPA: SlyX family protein [Fibrobacteraceae bacterium]|nr:SlyX family protein [Fibrobacteraceae bacterium]
MENRLTDIEVQIEYQERTLNALSDALAAQQTEIDQLRVLVRKLQAKLDEPGLSIGPANEKPPHY